MKGTVWLGIDGLVETMNTRARDAAGVDDIAVIEPMTKRWVRTQVSERRIPHYKRGGRLWFDLAEVEAWLRDGRVNSPDLRMSTLRRRSA